MTPYKCFISGLCREFVLYKCKSQVIANKTIPTIFITFFMRTSVFDSYENCNEKLHDYLPIKDVRNYQFLLCLVAYLPTKALTSISQPQLSNI